jgi:DNA-binding response OmpR family regulator
MRVLVASGELAELAADAIAKGLRRRTMARRPLRRGSGAERVAVHRYDVVILDRDLPKVHGDEACAIVAMGGEARVLMLTAAAGLGPGRRPTSARTTTSPSRSRSPSYRPGGSLKGTARPAARLERAGIRLDRRAARPGGRPLDLAPKEFAVLEVLMRPRHGGQRRGTSEKA